MLRQKTIKLYPDETARLKDLYVKRDIAVDSYEYFVAELRELTDEFNAQTGRSDAPNDILRYMRSERKQGRWPTLGKNCRQAPPAPKLTAEQTEVLVAVYTEEVVAEGHGSDEIGYDDELAERIAKKFALRTGLRLPPQHLNRKLTALRKRGLLPLAGRKKPDEGIGFRDIAKVKKKAR